MSGDEGHEEAKEVIMQGGSYNNRANNASGASNIREAEDNINRCYFVDIIIQRQNAEKENGVRSVISQII